LSIAGSTGRISGLLAAALVFLGAAGPASATTRFAVPGGTAGDSSCTSTGANCSLAHVLQDVVLTGDEVIVTPGTHDVGSNGVSVKSGVTTLNIHGEEGQPRPRIVATSMFFTFSTCPVSTCAGDGTVLRHLAIENQGSGLALAVFGGGLANPITLDDLEVRGGSAGLGILAFAQTGVPSAATIRNTTAYAPGSGASIAAIVSELNLTMRNVTAVAPASGSVGLMQTPNCNDGLGCTGDASATVFNTILAGGPGGADVRTTTSTNGCGNCFGNVSLDYSNFDEILNCSGCSASPAGGAHNQTAAPSLVNLAGGDFHELPTSPTVDGGVDDPANGSTDPDGNPRRLGPAPDIGAFEDGHPLVLTGAATNVTPNGGTLQGTVNPLGFLTFYHFQWGGTTAYGNRLPAADAGAGDGTAAQAVSQELGNLAPGTTVHYRVVATNLFGTVVGNDQSFTTLVPSQFAFAGIKLGVRVLRVRRGRYILIPIACPPGVIGSCTGRIKLVAARRRLTLGRASFSVRGGATKKVRLKLTRRARKLVRAKRRLRAIATLTATANATTKRTRQKVTVKNPVRR
jgi:hypothetical protein